MTNVHHRAPDAFDPNATDAFRYVGFDIDERTSTVRCHYALDDLGFTEVFTVEGPAQWSAAAEEAARLLFLLAGVSYYKAAAPPVIDLGDTPVRGGEHDFLRAFYLHGLGEYAWRNGLDLSGITVTGGRSAGAPATYSPAPGRPLTPFGGGIDSIVTVELLREQHDDIELFVVSRAGDRFDAIEDALAVARLPVARASREIDPLILRSRELGFRNGHVPVTGIISMTAVLTAVLRGRDAVVMSNEASASSGNVVVDDGREVNHQWSKSLTFETLLRDTLAGSLGPGLEYFSMLRPFSELWIAQRFAEHTEYHGAFRSCNRAFHIDRAARLDTWCGTCDKCCFIDLVLAPFVAADVLGTIFGGHEPLQNPALAHQFATLVGLTDDFKPFECVGDLDECRAAVAMAAARPDRASTPLLHDLAARLAPLPGAHDPGRLLQPGATHHIPPHYAPGALLH